MLAGSGWQVNAHDIGGVGTAGGFAPVGVHSRLEARLIEVWVVHQDERLNGHQHLQTKISGHLAIVSKHTMHLHSAAH